jgi:hypothetical protein
MPNFGALPPWIRKPSHYRPETGISAARQPTQGTRRPLHAVHNFKARMHHGSSSTPAKCYFFDS